MSEKKEKKRKKEEKSGKEGVERRGRDKKEKKEKEDGGSERGDDSIGDLKVKKKERKRTVVGEPNSLSHKKVKAKSKLSLDVELVTPQKSCLSARTSHRQSMKGLYSFSFIFCHFLSFSFIFCHFLSFSFIFFHFLSFSFIFFHFLSFSFIFFPHR
jgi:hypothetical protein